MPHLESAVPRSELESGRAALEANEYPGRIAIMGMATGGDFALQAYAIMGRSEHSKDRIFVQEGTTVRTTAPRKTPEEMALTPMAELIYYPALKTAEGVHVVSNGAQTTPVLRSAVRGYSLENAVKYAPNIEGVDLSMYEPDAPNNTPRITGIIDTRKGAATPFGLAIVRKAVGAETPIYSVYEAENIDPGIGYGVQTYNGNGDPLPSFDQDPYAIGLGRGVVDTAQKIWGLLNMDNRVSLVVRAIDVESGEAAGTCIINTQA